MALAVLAYTWRVRHLEYMIRVEVEALLSGDMDVQFLELSASPCLCSRCTLRTTQVPASSAKQHFHFERLLAGSRWNAQFLENGTWNPGKRFRHDLQNERL